MKTSAKFRLVTGAPRPRHIMEQRPDPSWIEPDIRIPDPPPGYLDKCDEAAESARDSIALSAARTRLQFCTGVSQQIHRQAIKNALAGDYAGVRLLLALDQRERSMASQRNEVA